MDAIVGLNSEVDRLVGMIDDEDPFDLPHAETLPRQLTAINERFQDRVEKIKLLQNRAEEGGINEVRSMHDVVPLLFAHTAYKSYPESWLFDGRWDRLGKWLDTVSTERVKPMDTSEVKGVDEWLALLETYDHYVSCSSGTTGKCAMMNATQFDLTFSGKALLQGCDWAGLNPDKTRRMINFGQVAHTPRNTATSAPSVEAFSRPGVPMFRANVPPITIGGILEMVMLRKRVAEGTAAPADIAHFEAVGKEREAAMESTIEQVAEAMITYRDEPLHLMGMAAPLYKVAALVRERGYTGKDFQPNTMFSAGGLKRVQVPDNYMQIIYETFNVTPERFCHSYGMQECNTSAVKCSHGRYHMAPWVMLLLLDESGENLIEPPASGEIEGRAAFFDLSLDGRWGGVISGDKVKATWERCGCGNASPSINQDIQRYADMASGDKIACSGTIDAYVRGVT